MDSKWNKFTRSLRARFARKPEPLNELGERRWIYPDASPQEQEIYDTLSAAPPVPTNQPTRPLMETIQDSSVMTLTKKFVKSYVTDQVELAIQLTLTFSTLVLALISYAKSIDLNKTTGKLTRRTKISQATAIAALAAFLHSACMFVGLTTHDVYVWAKRMIKDSFPKAAKQAGPVETVTTFVTSLIASLAASWGSRKSWTEIWMGLPANFSRGNRSAKDFTTTLKDIWATCHPDHEQTRQLNLIQTAKDRLETIASMTTRQFIDRDVQQEVRTLSEQAAIALAGFPKNDNLITHLQRRITALEARIYQRVNENRAVIEHVSQVRRKPVFINLRGQPGHGKSYLMTRLYRELNQWMLTQGHLARPMRELIGTGGGDNYLPPFGNQEWLAVDEYLANWDDTWVQVVNKVVSDNPTTISSAFIKNAEVHCHFFLTTSNVDIPFTFPRDSTNAMRREVLDAYHSRHNWVNVHLEGYDPTLGRDNQNRENEPVLTWQEMYTLPGDAGPTVRNTVISFDELVTKMKNMWTQYDERYQASLAEALNALAPDPEPAEPQIGKPGNPTVLGLFGATGTGKTFIVDNTIVPMLQNSHDIQVLDTIPDKRPSGRKTAFILDDKLTTAPDGFDRYRIFHDTCLPDDIIVLTDNYTAPETTRFADVTCGLIHIKSVLGNKFSRNQFIGFGTLSVMTMYILPWILTLALTLCVGAYLAYLWHHHGPHNLDHSALPHEALIRRLGFNCTSWFRGKLIAPSGPNASRAFLFSNGAIQDPANSCELASTEDIETAVARAICIGSPSLQFVGYASDPTDPDIDICISHPDEWFQAVAHPTAERYITIKRAIHQAFPDHQVLAAGITLDTPNSTIRNIFSLAYRRHPFTARIICGARHVVVNSGRCSGLSDDLTSRPTFELTDVGVLYTTDNAMHLINWADYLRRTFDTSVFRPADLIYLGQDRPVILAMPIALRSSEDLAITTRRTSYADSIMRAYVDFNTKIRSNPRMSLLIGLITLGLATGGVIWAVIGSRKKDDDDVTLESYQPAVDRLKKTAQKMPIRPAKESYEPKPNQALKRVQRVKLVNVAAGKQEYADGSIAKSCVPDTVAIAVKAVAKATGVISTSSGHCYGICVGGTFVLGPAHIAHDKDVTFSLVFNGQPCVFHLETHFLSDSRDIAMFRVRERTFPAQPSIHHFFVRDNEIVAHSCAFLYLTTENLLLSTDLRYSERLARNFFSSKSCPGWSPNQKIIFADHAMTRKMTKAGDCGSAYLGVLPRSECRAILGIHIGAMGSTTSLAAMVSQEDLSSMTALARPELSIPPVPDMTLATIGNICALLPEPVERVLMEKQWQDGGFSFDDTPRLSFIGHSKALFSPSWTRGGSLVATPISPFLNKDIIPIDQGPAPVSIYDTRIAPEAISALPTANGIPSLGAKQLSHISGQIKTISPDLFASVVTTCVAMWNLLPGIRDWKLLSTDETLNGIHEGPWAGYIDAIRGDTSPGLPWKKLGYHEKRSLLEPLNPPGGATRWAYAPTKGGRELASAVTLTLVAWENDHQVHRLIDCNLKVECVPNSKIRDGNARMFLAESMETFLAQRAVCGFLQALAMKTRWHRHQHHTTGINPTTEFGAMYQRLLEVGENGFDGDYSKFDKRIPNWSWNVLAEVLVQVAEGTPMGTHSPALLRRFVEGLRQKLYVFEGHIYEADGDQASGVYPTNIGDSWLNDIIIIATLTSIVKSRPTHPISQYVLVDGHIDPERLADVFAWFTHGDDVIMSVHADAEDLFNFPIFQTTLEELGMIFTDPSKAAGSYQMKKVRDLSFIGRTFEFDSFGSQPHGKLRRTALHRMMHWTEDPTWKQLIDDVLPQLARELRAYPKDEYEEIANHLTDVFSDLGHPVQFPSWTSARAHLNAERRANPVAGPLLQRLQTDAGRQDCPPLEQTPDCGPEVSNTGRRRPIQAKSQLESDVSSQERNLGCKSREYCSRIPELASASAQWAEPQSKRSPRTSDLSMAVGTADRRLPGPESGMAAQRTTEQNPPKQSIFETSPQLKRWDETFQTVLATGPDIFTLKKDQAWTLTATREKLNLYDAAQQRQTQASATTLWSTTTNNGRIPLTPGYERYMHFCTRYTCMACGNTCGGSTSLASHLQNSHPHLPGINFIVFEEPAVVRKNKTAQHITTLVAGLQINAQPEMEAGDSLTMAASGPSPADGLAYNASEQTTADASNMGIELVRAPPAMVSGTTCPDETAIALLGPALPPALGVITGSQRSAYDIDRGTYNIVADLQVVASTTAQGALIQEIKLHQFTGAMLDRMDENVFVAGSTLIQVQFYGVTNTAGAMVVYQVDDCTDQLASLSEILHRPHFLLSAAAGTTTQAFILHETADSATPRRTKALDALRRPALRIVMYSKLQNTYGTDVDLNLKVLTKPGPDFRMWERAGASAVKQKIFQLPDVEHIVCDTNRYVTIPDKPAPNNILSSIIGENAWRSQVAEVPNAFIGEVTARHDRDNRSGLTGQLCATWASTSSKWDGVACLSGSADITIPYTTSDSDTITKSFGSTVATAELPIPTIGCAGAIGYTGAPEVPSELTGVLSTTRLELCRSTALQLDVYSGSQMASQGDNYLYRQTACTALLSLFNKESTSGNLRSLLPRIKAPPTIAANLVGSNVVPPDTHAWSSTLRQLLNEWGPSSWILSIDGAPQGRVAVFASGDPIGGVHMLGNFPEKSFLPVDDRLIKLSDPQTYTQGGGLPSGGLQWETLIVPERREFEAVRERLISEAMAPKFRLEFGPPRGLARRRVLPTLSELCPRFAAAPEAAAAAILGGAFAGLGAGVGQMAQNKWWEGEMQKQRGHELQTIQMQADAAAGMQKRDIENNVEKNSLKAAHSAASKGMTTKAYDKPPSYDELQLHQTQEVTSDNLTTTPTGNAPRTRPQGKFITPKASKAKVSPSQTTPPTGQVPKPTEPMGLNKSSPEMYHPSNLAQSGSSIMEPMTVSSAVNPYTEGMKHM